MLVESRGKFWGRKNIFWSIHVKQCRRRFVFKLKNDMENNVLTACLAKRFKSLEASRWEMYFKMHYLLPQCAVQLMQTGGALTKQLLWRFQLKKDVNKIFSNQFGICSLLETWTTLSPSASVVWNNAATLFCFENPEMFCGLWNFRRLSIDSEVRRWKLNFNSWVNFSFNVWFRDRGERDIRIQKSEFQQQWRLLWLYSSLLVHLFCWFIYLESSYLQRYIFLLSQKTAAASGLNMLLLV